MSIILVIDDNEDCRAGFIEVLEFEAHTTLEAENGQIGLEMMRQDAPDLIICDVDMPVMNGIEVLRTAKADPTYAKIPFVMLTGHTDELTRKTSRDLGAEAYLTKPIAITEFLSTIGSLLKKRRPHFITISPQTIADASGPGTEGTCPAADGEKSPEKDHSKELHDKSPRRRMWQSKPGFILYIEFPVGKDHNPKHMYQLRPSKTSC